MSKLRHTYKSNLKKMPNGGNTIARDNTMVRPLVNVFIPESETEILKEFYPKPKPQVDPFVKDLLKSADLGTDILQLGHFIPDPLGIGQTAAFVGDVTGKWVDGAQALINAYEGDYENAVGNTVLAAAPGLLKKQGYTRPNSLMTGKGKGVHYPLTATTPALAKNPVIKKGLNYNRGFLGATAAEINSNLNYNLPTYLNNNNPRTYSDNTRVAPRVRKMPNGGLYPVGDYDKTLAPKEGNFLLPDINRPGYIDNEGNFRSEYKMSVNIGGKETIIPTVVNGKQLSEDEAIDRYMKTGLHMGKFDTPQQADYEARLRTARYNMLQDPLRFTASQFKNGGEMIKRKDGSYSRRGLWDNIRANRGSGKKPTKQMLQQEKKIKSMEKGGSLYKAYLDTK